MRPDNQSEFICRWEPTELASTLLSPSCQEVVSHWISAIAFLDENAHPILLATNTQSEPNFNQLAHAVNPGFVPVVVLNELLRKGLVEQLDSGQLLLRRSAYVHDAPSLESPPVVRRKTYSPGRNAGRRRND